MSSSTPAIRVDVAPSGPGCLECDATGSWWLHLRRCAECGHVGCCDSSLNKHATAHFHASGHPVIQSFEPGEEWFWDYATEEYLDGPLLTPPRSHPRSQSVPGPAARVPSDWESELSAE